MRWIAGLLVVTGCQFNGVAAEADATANDAAADGGQDAPLGVVHSLAFGDISAGVEIAQSNVAAIRFIDTTSGEVRDGAGAVADFSCERTTLGAIDVCALWFSRFDLNAEVRVIGEVPLVLISSDRIRVEAAGRLFAGSGLFAGFDASGPGANPTVCDSGGTGASGLVLNNVAGGGGGGGFVKAGAAGGNGANGGSGGTGGESVLEPTSLRGGCPGGDGGDDINTLGPGGAGGGALYLASLGNDIRITGVVSVAGGGGSGGDFVDQVSEGGGGGGGSGGMIVFDGAVDLRNEVRSNGGGGGEGGERDANEEAGNAGSAGLETSSVAPGGTGAPGGDGGNGGTLEVAPVDGTSNTDAGGGGGGSDGFVVSIGR